MQTIINRRLPRGGLGAALCGLAACFASLPYSLAFAQSVDNVVCERQQVCRDRQTQLPLRALVRPLAQLRDGPDDAARAITGTSPFQPWFVFERRGVDYTDANNPRGWFQVHDSAQLPPSGQPFGWVHARDIFEWRNAIVVSYTAPGVPPDQRGRVMMFSDRDRLRGMLAGAEGASRARSALADLDANRPDMAERHGVVMAEPRAFIDINNRFYILPVLSFEPLEGLGREARLLRVAAAVPQVPDDSGRVEPGRGPTLGDEGVRRRVGGGGAQLGQSLRNVGVDIKFVIDMTGSMQPYLDATRDAVVRLMDGVARGSEDFVRFGLVGYTDIAAQCGDCRFPVARNFTPEGPTTWQRVRDALASADARAAGGGDWPETVFEGVIEAMNSPWRENTLRFIVLIGDASANQPGQKGALLTAESVRSQLEANSVYALALHIKPTGAGVAREIVADHSIAEAQFRALTAGFGAQAASSYHHVAVNPAQPSEATTQFEDVVRRAAQELVEVVGAARRGDPVALAGTGVPGSRGAPPSVAPPAGGAVEGVVRRAASAALIEYLGRTGERPRDLVAWVADVDLADTTRDALDVRVLLDRGDLSNLIEALTGLVQGSRRGAMTEMNFFNAVQTVVTGATLDRMTGLGSAEGAARLAPSIMDIMPRWLASLPYRTALQRMTFDDVQRMNPNERANFERDLEAKLHLYRSFNNDSDIWRALAPGHSDLLHVFPMRLSDLP
jgi:serine/threonine-protein kinase PpkA